MVYVSRFFLGLVSLTHFWIMFLWSEMTSYSASQNVDTELGQAPTSEARPQDTDHLLPSNLAAKTRSLVEHTFSKLGGDPSPGRWALAAAVKRHVRKARCFRCCWTEREKPEPCVGLGFKTTNGKTGFVFCFPIQLRDRSHRACVSPKGDSLTCILYMQVTDTWSLLGECIRL